MDFLEEIFMFICPLGTVEKKNLPDQNTFNYIKLK